MLRPQKHNDPSNFGKVSRIFIALLLRRHFTDRHLRKWTKRLALAGLYTLRPSYAGLPRRGAGSVADARTSSSRLLDHRLCRGRSGPRRSASLSAERQKDDRADRGSQAAAAIDRLGKRKASVRRALVRPSGKTDAQERRSEQPDAGPAVRQPRQDSRQEREQRIAPLARGGGREDRQSPDGVLVRFALRQLFCVCPKSLRAKHRRRALARRRHRGCLHGAR
jgi:hypothetical protein